MNTRQDKLVDNCCAIHWSKSQRRNLKPRSKHEYFQIHLISQLLSSLAQYSGNTHKLQEHTTSGTFTEKIIHTINVFHPSQVGY